ncbi:MAG: hypothetical protein IJO24_05165 [Clostridia bacterium]|nr:hypothetical protein [Clostridia bacterium]
MQKEKTINGPLPVVDYPFLFDGITDDEACFENRYLNLNYELCRDRKYEPLIKQLLEGKIAEIPVEYLKFTPSFLDNENWRYTKETYYKNHSSPPVYL